MEKTLYETIVDALNEAKIMECACDRYDVDRLLFTAQRLSGAPFSFVKEVHDRIRMKEIL